VSTTLPGFSDRVMARLWPEPDPYETDPVGWTESRLGEFLWSKQVVIMEAVVGHRHVAVHSAHDTGKSFDASRLVAWWLDSHPIGQAFAVTTAPTQPQVNAILWREIRRAHRKGELDGRTTLDAQWYMGEDELVAFGRKPADYTDPEDAKARFQGIHAKYVLVILDEAAGIPAWLWDAVESLATNEHSRVLAIGNPDDPSSEFAKVCAPGSGWHTIHVSAYDTPAFTGEDVPQELLDVLVSPLWVEERRRKWGEESPLFQSKVLGVFPEIGDDTLIPPSWILQAQEQDLSGQALVKGQFGADVAREGPDETVVYWNRGGMVRLAYSARKQKTTRTTGAFSKLVRDTHKEVPIVVDAIGIGAGVSDSLEEQGLPVMPYVSSEQPWNTVRFVNRRAESYWDLRTKFEQGLVDLDPLDEDLAAQLGSIKYFLTSRGKIQIESKDDMKKRGLPSPDRADALVMAVSVPASLWPKGLGQRSATQQRTPGLTDDLLDRRM